MEASATGNEGNGWHDIGSLADLERVGWVSARVGGREVGVVVDPETGKPHALRNRCPHHGAPLCRGTVRSRLSGTPGHYDIAGRRVLACPWHGWEFDLENGHALDDPRMRVATYPVTVTDGRVLVRA